MNITRDKTEKTTFLLGSNGRNCAVPSCNSYGDLFDNSCKKNVTYHKIPSAPELKTWIQRNEISASSANDVINLIFKMAPRLIKRVYTLSNFC